MNAAYAKHIANVDKHRDLILEAERHIWKTPRPASVSGRPAPIWRNSSRRWAMS